LLEHWDGTVWSQVASPNPSAFGSRLSGVTADASDDAWAVGFFCPESPGCSVQRTLILHWDGTAWSQVVSPNPNKRVNYLTSVSATSPSDAWAVGSMRAHTGRALVLRWNGALWSVVPSPNPRAVTDSLSSVTAVSPADAWAVGFYGNGVEYRTLINHWDGAAWSKVKSPSPGSGGAFLTGVSAGSTGDASAVGYFAADGGVLDALVLRWNGVSWSKPRHPNPSTNLNVLYGVANLSSSEAWAVGDFQQDETAAIEPFVVHSDGTSWRKAKSPAPSSTINILYGVSATSATDAWAVGYYDDGSRGVSRTLILHWNGSRWSAPQDSSAARNGVG
jgi:hypothetical protein